MTHPFGGVAIAGVFNTEQARRLPGESVLSLTVKAILGACGDAGIDAGEIDGVVGMGAGEVIYELGLAPAIRTNAGTGIASVISAAQLITGGQASVVVVAGAGAALLSDDGSAASWTRPANELVASYGLFTAAEFALMARRHMVEFGTTREQMAHVAATIRNNGSAHPEAVYSGRGPFVAEDVVASPPVAEPFNLLDCATTSEGGAAVLLTSAERVPDLATDAAFIHGAGVDAYGAAYTQAPSFDRRGRDGEPAGYVGRRAAKLAFRQAGLGVADVDVCEFYDPFSFEIIRQFEAFGFCPDGEGGEFVTSGIIEPGGRYPVTTDGGTMSFAHPGINAQMLQRVIRGVQQVRGSCRTMQVPDAEVAMCTNGGSGALFTDVMLVGSAAP